MPIDINLLRKEKGGDPEKVKLSQKQRFADETLVDQVIDLDEQWRKSNYQKESLKMEFNKVNKDIADRKKASKGKDGCEDLMEKSKEIKTKIEEQEKQADSLDAQRNSKLNLIGNIVSDKVPIFKDEDNNEIRTTWGTLPSLEVDGKTIGKLHHHEIMGLLDLVEFERGQKVAGHRGYFLKGYGVMLNQALINFGLTSLFKSGYTPLQPPFFMKSTIMHETCQLSDFDENLYKVEGTDDKDPLYLIATSEQPISAMHRDEWIEPADLPFRYAGNSSCFRKEAGSHGKDVWGIFRIHQFEKVEQFVLAAPDKSWEELEKMITASEKFYQELNLPYQVIKIVSGALNDAAAMKMDLEAWFPGYKAYRELVSCSNCTDYQSRALRIRYAEKNLEKGASTPFVHLLNGTLCATERTLCCIMENYQTPEGLNIPKALQPYMGGLEFIPYDQKKVKAWLEKVADEEKKGAGKDKKKDGKEEKKEEKKVEKKEEKKTESKATNNKVPQKERTYIMIKPDGVQRGLIGKILARFETKGFKLVGMKLAQPGKEQFKKHYADLSTKPFFQGLVDYAASGPVCCMVWEGDNAVKTGRKMLGATKPFDSEPGTIRGDFCIDVGRNVIHGSDSVESANKEIALWFKPEELVSWVDHSHSWVYE